MSEVEQQINGDILVIKITNPPVNALGLAVRTGLIEGIQTLNENDALKAAVIIGDGRTFPAGADIREFGKPPVEPHLPDVVNTIEASAKPVVAAIHGQALGGGLEVALGSHYRIADPKAKMGLPEVNLGLIPGAGGTQRLPQTAPLEAAIQMITSGRPIPAPQAHEFGLIDQLSDGDLEKDAISFAQNIADQDFEDRRFSAADASGLNEEQKATLAAWRQKLPDAEHGGRAAQAALDAIEAGLELGFEKGSTRERELFLGLKTSPESRALRHIFFAPRQSAKLDGEDAKAAPKDLKKIAVIGGGTMGSGIAFAALTAGYHVTLIEVDQDRIDFGLGMISKFTAGNVKKGRMSEAQAEALLAQVKGSTDYADLADVDLVVEAIVEVMDIKKKVFASLNEHCKADAVIASNTSFLNIDELAADMDHPENVLGLHFFAPAHIMKLLEIVRGAKTSAETLATGLSFAKALRKTAVISGVCPGFIGNRVMMGYIREAGYLLSQGFSPADVDGTLEDFGMAMGPMAVSDLSGLDIGYNIRQALELSEIEKKSYSISDQLVEAGALGQKTRQGYYIYEKGKERTENPLALEFINNLKEADAVTPPKSEIIDRCIMALVSEGIKVVTDGIARSPDDIDVTYVYGYGFPAYRGGPMQYAREIGVDEVVAKIAKFAATGDQDWWASEDQIRKVLS